MLQNPVVIRPLNMSSKLFQAIEKKCSCWEVEKILLKHPKAIKQKDNDGNSMLLHALWKKASDDVVKMLFEKYQKAVKEKDNYGMLH